jgi:hypothetical protein
MPVEELLTRWTIRIALLLYAAGTAALALSRRRTKYLREARLAWTAGCVFLWLHLAAAFHFYHAWSHWAAYEATAKDTAAAIGRPFGAGVYFNYLFGAVWTADVWFWWKRGLEALLARARWLNWSLHGFLFFIVFNATVTFGDGALRWTAAVMFLVLAVIAVKTRRWLK